MGERASSDTLLERELGRHGDGTGMLRDMQFLQSIVESLRVAFATRLLLVPILVLVFVLTFLGLLSSTRGIVFILFVFLIVELEGKWEYARQRPGKDEAKNKI